MKIRFNEMATFLGLSVVTSCVGIMMMIQLFEPVNGVHVLAISSFAGKSQWYFMRGIFRALTDHGHRVTVFTPFLDGDRENYTEIDLSKEVKTFLRLDIDTVQKSYAKHKDLIRFVYANNRDSCKMLYRHDALRNMTKFGPSSGYDVVFVELRASECLSRLSVDLDAPLVYVSSPPIISYMEGSILGHYPNPAVVSHTLAGQSVPRTFFQRVANTLLSVYTSCSLLYESLSADATDRQPFDLAEPVKPSLVFTNAHYVSDAPRSLPPNVIQIGGVHLGPPKRIPADILEFIENSPNGVLIFTLGSVIAISSLAKQVQEAIIEGLGQVPQRVLLKYEDELTTNLPNNIMTRKWFPQRDILLHPNVKLFISHGGLSGVYEAVDAGVPILGFPIFFDQTRNIQNVIDAGMAISLNLETLTKDTFVKAISELVNDGKYMLNAKITSDQFKDRPMSPGQLIDYWTRYVVRHKGAHHLKSHALNLTWYQYFLLDVIIVILILLLSVIYTLYSLLKLLHKYCIYKTKPITKSKPE